MPSFSCLPEFALLVMPMMRGVAMGSLMGHVIYGLILSAGFVALRHEAADLVREAQQAGKWLRLPQLLREHRLK
jgi:hypothetical protein